MTLQAKQFALSREISVTNLEDRKKPLKNIVYLLDALVNRQLPVKEAYELLMRGTEGIQDYHDAIREVTKAMRDANYSGDYLKAQKRLKAFVRIPGALDIDRIRKIEVTTGYVDRLESELAFHANATRFYLSLPQEASGLMTKKVKSFLRNGSYIGTLAWIVVREEFHRVDDTGIEKAVRLSGILLQLKEEEHALLKRIENVHGRDSIEQHRLLSVMGHLEYYLSSYLAASGAAPLGTAYDLSVRAIEDIEKSHEEAVISELFALGKLFVSASGKPSCEQALEEFNKLKRRVQATDNKSFRLRVNITDLAFVINLRGLLIPFWDDVALSLIDNIVRLSNETRNDIVVETMFFPLLRKYRRTLESIIAKDGNRLVAWHRFLYDFHFRD